MKTKVKTALLALATILFFVAMIYDMGRECGLWE